ncbi:transcriptional repressor LexA [Pseudoxanthomonas indica]|uniref:LexA repressor n=1 Tax=Pseudoxanthomonas indica TaxID=428993 RepID=A0A1T5LZT9_9GAMM|nr:transcriptional repressor LexA [Pseudoxanthomonas indica]GGD59761.1 LexA repressor 1 [Pseudoxanthomonas indica]SKC81511.1 SOS-response transcriptional repressor, LexA [Pseudoxanthomonas indica]
MSLSLTSRQAAILAVVRQRLAETGSAPTLQEIGAAVGIAHVSAVFKHMEALEKKGYVSRDPSRPRGVRLLAPAMGEAGDALNLPVVGRVAAGQPVLSDGEIERTLWVDSQLFRLRPDYLLRVEGDSMRDDGILDGDLVGVHVTPEARHGQIVVARLGDEGITIKRLYRTANQLRLLPRSAGYLPIDPDPSEDFAIEGLYCGLIRQD